MLKPAFLYLILCCCAFLPVHSQQKYIIQLLTQGPLKSIRGMSVVTDSVIWVSGTGGMVGKSTNGGRQWQWVQVPGCDSCDWRDIEAFNDHEALVINAGEPAHIFRTKDGGSTWQRVYFNDTKGIFFDGMDFRDPQRGFAVGDPLEGRFMLLYTRDGGEHWDTMPTARRPVACAGEAIFAASGSGICTAPDGNVCFVTGGDTARFIRMHLKREAFALPILQGSPSTGAFSVAFLDRQQGIVVGGDYRNDTLRRQNCLLTRDGGKTWTAPAVPPFGFRSCVAWMGPNELITTGTSGTDLSTDAGMHWQNISREGFHVVQKAKKGKAVFLAGSEGRIAQLIINKE